MNNEHDGNQSNQGNPDTSGNGPNQGYPAQGGYPPQNPPQYPPHYPPHQPKSPIAGILFALVVLLLGAVGFLMYERFAGDGDEEAASAAEAQPDAPAQAAAAPAATPAPTAAPAPTPTVASAPTPAPIVTGRISKGGMTWLQNVESIETDVVAWGSKLRAIPGDGSNAKILGSVTKGAKVRVLATTDVMYLQAPWHLVQVNGLRGYISGDFLCAPSGMNSDMFYNSNNCQ